MDIFNRITPVYKTAASLATKATHALPAVASGGLSGLLGSLFGNATPIYKSVDGGGVNAPASSSGLFGSLFGSLLGTGSPSYKTAPVAPVENIDDAPIDADAGDGDASVPCVPCVPTSDEVVLL